MFNELPYSTDLSVLSQPLTVLNKTIKNRLCIQPMEGCDGTADGSPDTLTARRYDRFSKSGAGVIWFEAVAVMHDGRANLRQLWLTEKNLDEFKKIVTAIKETSYKECGFVPVIIMQATHSGRYSKPNGKPEPLIAYNSPIFEGDNPIPTERIITDEKLKEIEEAYGTIALLCQKAGFDGIDIKACHRYLNSELLSAFTRKGIYGGSFENRTRFFQNVVNIVRSVAEKNFIVTSRLNIYDGFPYPYGFGVTENNGIEPDLTEAIMLIKMLNMEFINITAGNPYVNPQVNRPTDLEGVKRMYTLTKIIAESFNGLKIISSAPTYMRENAAFLAAGAVSKGYASMVGFGRLAFAYPNFAKDILAGKFDKKQMCITCAQCSQLMRNGFPPGCVVRDEFYTNEFKLMNSR